jgi:predicted Zn-dependent peptidase
MSSAEYRVTTLANGLRVVSAEMPHLHSVEMMCYLKAGSRDELPQLAGISHFLEHVLFRGTAEYPTSLELERAFEAIGGAVNAATDVETTCFHSRLHPGHLREGAALFASMLLRPSFADVDLERRIILEEALEDLNEKGEEINPDNLIARLLWPGHPMGQPTIGTRASIERIDAEALRRHHAAYYRPDNMVLVAAGQVDHDRMLAAAEAAFGSWRDGGAMPEPFPPPPQGGEGPESVWVRDPGSQVNLQLAFRLPGRQHPHAAALRVLRWVLSWGGTSRLMLRLRETLGLTYSVEANLALFADCGCFAVDLATAPANLLEAVRELLAIFEALCAQPVGKDELARVVHGFLFDLDFSRDHSDDLAVRYGWGELVGYLRTLEMDRREIAAVTPDDLLAAAREFFVPANLKAALVGPFRSTDRREVERLLAGYRETS